MHKSILGTVLVAALVLAPVAFGRERLRDRLKDRGDMMNDGNWAERMKSSLPHQSLSYGPDKRQNVDFFQLPGTAPPPPLVIFVHGGGWRRGSEKMVDQKPEFYTGFGYAFASVGYRMLPDTAVEQQAEDIGAAIRMLRSKARALGFDGNRIILTGHSAGAHLVALLGTNPLYAEDAFDAIRGVMPIDGACYDVARQMKQQPLISKKLYEPAFGIDPVRQKALSPITYGAGPNAPDWFLLYSSKRKDSTEQNKLLEEAVKTGGSRTESLALPLGHGPINIELGTPGYGGNAAIEKWLAAVSR